jgi:transketolase
MESINNLSEIAKEIRKKIFKAAYKGNTGHLASAFSIVEILSVLYFRGVLKYDPQNPTWVERDKLILSKGHACLALYSVLSMAGYFDEKVLDTYCRPGSALGGEPKLGDIAGIEASTGSLGHGLSFALGIAMANKFDDMNNKVYAIVGDGECQEGSIWEAVIAAAHYKLDNLIVILDHNKLQAMGPLEEIIGMGVMADKWRSFGWQVEKIDGHNTNQIFEGLNRCAEQMNGKPKVIIADTIKGKGVSFMENVPIWHYRMPNQAELEIVMDELGLSKQELGI